MSRLLDQLEDNSISIIKETFSRSTNPIVLYSIGKDSSVLLHLFRKAFYPNKPKINFLHIDTGWKFREMIEFRNQIGKKYGVKIIVKKNLDGEEKGITPFNNDNYTNIMKTDALKEALSEGKYDFVYGGARRDEESSRSKEKIVSHRDKYHKWDPKNQRIEPWGMFNTELQKDESFRVFPLSNWTELNIWQYIQKEKIEIVPLYFAKERNVIIRDNEIYLYDDKRFEVKKTDLIKKEFVRFRTLGCYPLTAGVKSKANTLSKIIKEIEDSEFSERSGRLIDFDKVGSMELKKIEGYF
ncbi:sulfate adenylyltransferase subunit 2 [Acidimicrobiaceae bacterium]|nr:sulfate adenylyltransferase subunit 2 [Acidimicrobiaceae bacterium]